MDRPWYWWLAHLTIAIQDGLLAQALAGSFNVVVYDRRGRGDSGDVQPYGVAREIEDLAAIMDAVGGEPSVFGFSAGAALAFRAAAAKTPMRKLVLFGTPFVTDDSRSPVPVDLAENVKSLVASNKRGEAVDLFQRDAIGMPEALIEQLRNAPFRPGLEAMANTLPYDLTIIAGPPMPIEQIPLVDVETLVIAGANSPDWIRRTANLLAGSLPNGEHLVIQGLAQDLDVELLQRPIIEFIEG